jgi:hypothetical protein
MKPAHQVYTHTANLFTFFFTSFSFRLAKSVSQPTFPSGKEEIKYHYAEHCLALLRVIIYEGRKHNIHAKQQQQHKK